MDSTIIASYVGVAGVVIAALLSSFGYLYRLSTDGRKSRRKALYLLLELRQNSIIALFDPAEVKEEYYRHFQARLSKKGIPIDPETLREQFGGMVEEHFRKILTTLQTDIELRLLKSYEEALLELSKTKPVLAFQLHGREKIEKLIDLSKDHCGQVDQMLDGEDAPHWIKLLISESAQEAKEEALDQLSLAIDEDVLRLAKACGRADLKECKNLLQKGLSNDNKYDFSELDSKIDKIIDKLIHAVQKHATDKNAA